MTITRQQRRAVRKRADDCCEYCRLPQSSSTLPFHVDHVIPLKHDGLDDTDNFCLACYKCNGYKSSDVGGFDPATRDLTRLYHPREQTWEDHFRLEADMTIIGITPAGRTTVRVLRMNDDAQLEHRRMLAELDDYPCEQAD